MKITAAILAYTSLSSLTSATVRSANAQVDWITTSNTYQAGKPVQTAIRMAIDPGWHSYWLNPGESGIKTSVVWDLPAGWTVGELEHPVPARISRGGSANIGYQGTVIFPVQLTPPLDATGPATIKLKITWLTCDDQACVPGSAQLSLALEDAPPDSTSEATLIAQALTRVPRPHPDWGSLQVVQENNNLTLEITGLGKTQPDLTGCETFALTPDLIDPHHLIEFIPQASGWSATVPKSEYSPHQIRELSIVIVPKSEVPPILLTWKIP